MPGKHPSSDPKGGMRLGAAPADSSVFGAVPLAVGFGDISPFATPSDSSVFRVMSLLSLWLWDLGIFLLFAGPSRVCGIKDMRSGRSIPTCPTSTMDSSPIVRPQHQPRALQRSRLSLGWVCPHKGGTIPTREGTIPTQEGTVPTKEGLSQQRREQSQQRREQSQQGREQSQ